MTLLPERDQLIDTFLIEYFSDSALERCILASDASHRRYERIRCNEKTYVLMDDASRLLPTIAGSQKSYGDLVSLGIDINCFVSICEFLRMRGFSAPKIFQINVDDGLILLEDFGDSKIATDGLANEERYHYAIKVLSELHGQQISHDLQNTDGIDYSIPSYNTQIFAIENSLFLDWYYPYRTGKSCSEDIRQSYTAAWLPYLQQAMSLEQSLILRDYHSPNLLWLDERQGIKKIGLIDFQDAIIGPASYDVASLIDDARLVMNSSLQETLYTSYIRYRQEQTTGFDEDAFRLSFDIMAAQRSNRILGNFARSYVRDNKKQYLSLLPNIRRYLRKRLAGHHMEALRLWYQQHSDIYEDIDD